MTTTSELVDIFKNEYSAFVCQTNKEANHILKTNKTTTYVYALIADGDIVILGEGTRNRKIVMYPGFKAPSHQKVFIAAAATNVCKDLARIIIPTKFKKIKKKDSYTQEEIRQTSELLEAHLFNRFNFHDKKVREKNMLYYFKRLEQLNMKEKRLFTKLMLPLLDSQGSDMGGYKKWVFEWDEEPELKGLKTYINKLLGNYYKDAAFNEV